MKNMVATNKMCMQRHHNVRIVEDGLCVDKIYQVVVLEVSGIVEWHCV